MKNKSRVICLCIIFTLFAIGLLFAQNDNRALATITKKISIYGVMNAPSGLFCHFDKTVYTENESVWFTAYLVNYQKQNNNPGILAAALVKAADNSIVVSKQYMMNNGLAFGHLFIPALIAPGEYVFLVYSNILLNGKPRDVFYQPVTIKSTIKPGLRVSLVIDTGAPANSLHRCVYLKALMQDGTSVAGADVSYKLGYKQDSLLSGKVKTDINGQYLFSIPADKLATRDNILTASVTYKKESSNVSLMIPAKRVSIRIKFYPEGGNMVHATQSTIGWEASDIYGTPVGVSGVLYKDDVPIDTIYTNIYGMGRFKLTPLAGSAYKVRLIGRISDSNYVLPRVLLKGPVITLDNAIVNDSLQCRIVSKYPAKYFILIHNYRQTFFSFPVYVTAAGKPILINLKEIPRGLTTITILDTLQRPCAERLFFAHHNKRTFLKISTDKSSYFPRQKVALKLRLNSLIPDSLKGIVSVACVQKNRVDEKFNDIESYVYLKRELEAIPYREHYLGQNQDDMNYLENVLLIKGWRKYNWQEVLETPEKDTLIHIDSISSFNGVVNRNGKELEQKVNVMIFQDTLIKTVPTDTKGYFTLKKNQLITSEGKMIQALVDNSRNFGISIKNPFEEIDKSLANTSWLDKSGIFSQLNSNSNSLALTGLNNSMVLKDVIIKGTRALREDGSPYTSVGPNDCGDYVCRFNVLDCPNHLNESDNHPPMKGQTYIISNSSFNNKTMIRRERSYLTADYDSSYGEVFYTGCDSLNPNVPLIKFDGIYNAKTYYAEDYSQFNPPGPDFVSTIYWKHYVTVTSTRDIDLSFYTGDITGLFKIVVQGIATNDVIYGETEFNVTGK